MNTNYIRCTDAETIRVLKKLGFVVLSENNGVATFLNDPKTIRQYSNLKVTFTNILHFDGGCE